MKHVSILIIADSNFIGLCDDPASYVDKLKGHISKEFDVSTITLSTVNGKYGWTRLDPTMELVMVDDSTRSTFVQSLENAKGKFDVVYFITNCTPDLALNGLRETMTYNKKTIIKCGYKTK